MAYPRRFSAILYLAVLLCCPMARAVDDPLPPVQTVFLILMENQPWSYIEGNPNAPYINNVLLPQAAYCKQYYNPSNFTCSLLSYLWLEAGTDFGLSLGSNCDGPPSINHQSTTNHLVSLLERAGISWKAYEEAISGTNVPLTDAFPYAVRHDPFVYFDDVTGTNDPYNAYGIAHIRPYSELAGDLTNQTVARYNFITPDVCHDMHDYCAPLNNQIQQGDTWLSQELPKLMASSAYSNNGAIFITWDDAGVAGVPIGLILLSPLKRAPGYTNNIYYTHSSTLRTIQEIFQVTPFLGGAANATSLSDLFVPVPQGFRINHITNSSSNVVELTVGCVMTNYPLVLQTSADLVNWQSIQTNSSPAATVTLQVTNPPSQSAGYYRFLQPVP